MTASVAPTNTRIPRQILRRVENATKRYTETDTPNPADDADTAPKPAATSATPAEPPAGAPAVDPRENDPAYWKQRFSVTQGMLAKERDDRRKEREAHDQRLTELQTRTSAAPAAEPDIDLALFYTPAEIETYGEEQCRVMARAAMRAATATTKAQVDAEVRPLKEQREREATETAERKKQEFIDKLVELHPGYQQDDVDPRWLAWLDQLNDDGEQRQGVLNRHIATSNAAAIANMFKSWRKSIPAAPVPPVAPSGTGAAPAGDGTPPTAEALAGLTAPSKAEVADFYKRSATKRRGQPGFVTDEERVQFEARLKLQHPG